MQKRVIIFLTLLLLSFPYGGKDGLGAFLWAETMPQGYYDAIQGKADSVLKTTLHTIISGGERWPYGYDCHTTNNAKEGWKIGDPKICTWMGFNYTDKRSDGTVWDMYSGTKRYFPMNFGSAAGMDIEHSFPKSWWGAPTKASEYNKDAAYCDLYHLCPADRVANNNKSNFPPGILADSSKVNNGFFFMGRDNTWGGLAFSIIDEYKGDFARAYFYIATAYEDRQWVTDYKAYVNNDSYLTLTPYLVQILLDWHRLDPVSQKEIDRLDAISTIQHNRNPFIEYPELVEYIWGNKKGQTVQLENLVRTTSEEYIVPVSGANPTAIAAANVCQNGFTARWYSTGSETYELHVFTQTTTGHNDTIVAMPGFKKTILDTIPQLSWLNADGSTSTFNNMDGIFATATSTTTALKQLRIHDFGTAPKNCYLSVKCCVFKSDNSADLVIKGDNDEVLYTQPLVLDEQFYTFAIPEGTKTLSLWQKELGSSKAGYHRISLQQVYLFAGDEQTIQTPVEGYPLDVTGESYKVTIEGGKEGQTYFYNVTPKGLRTTNTIRVTLTSDPCPSTGSVAPLSRPTNGIHKVLLDGHIYLVSPYSSTPLPLYSL